MEEIKIKNSRIKYLFVLIGAFGFVACGLFLVVKTDAVWVGWMSILFFGSMIPLFIWQLKDTAARLIINDQGVYDRTLKVGMIPWHDIQNAFIKEIAGNSFVCLELKNTEHYLSKLNPLMKAAVNANIKLGFTPLSLNLSGVNADANQILEVVIKMSAARNG